MSDDPNWRRKLETEAREGRAALAALDQAEQQREVLEREVAFRRAGIDPDSGGGALLFKSWDGPNDPQAVLQAAEQYGLSQAPIPQEYQQAMTRISEAVAGGVASGSYDPSFETKLDAIPMIVNGEYNPDYQNQVLAATAAQAAKEGRQFSVDTNVGAKWHNSGGMNSPATNPIR